MNGLNILMYLKDMDSLMGESDKILKSFVFVPKDYISSGLRNLEQKELLRFKCFV